MGTKATEWRPGPTVCRCCLSEGCYKDISTEYFWMGKREVYEEMLTETFDLTVSFSKSGGPNSNSRLICEPCISRLRDATEFKRQVQECERTFMQYLDPGTSVENTDALEVEVEPNIKVETVKLEKRATDEEFENDDDDFTNEPMNDDDDYDDLDDEPLMKLASNKTPKEETNVLDILNSTKPEKRKATIKLKATSAKKTKKEAKPTSSKPKPEKKKKEKNHAYVMVRRNAELIVKYTTAYPFRLPEDSMVCVFCCETYDDPTLFRSHMDQEHKTFKLRTAFLHCNEGYLKVDITELKCRLCLKKFDNLNDVSEHLRQEHNQPMNLDHELGVKPFKLEKDKLMCAICNMKCLCLRNLSRHTLTHFANFTCEACGKSYATMTTLRHHITYSHASEERICRKCKKTFSSLEAKREHLSQSKKCWSHLCHICGERFLTWTSKQLHLNDVHGISKRSYPCPECGEVFPVRKKYRVHFKIMHTDDNFICTCCGRKFDTQKNLESHLVIHTKEKLFPCPMCSKSFPRKKNLTQHMWIHSELKRFSCTLCNKQFNQRVSWKAHMKAHHPDIVNYEDMQNKNAKIIFKLVKSE